jgi:hypothetical protein
VVAGVAFVDLLVVLAALFFSFSFFLLLRLLLLVLVLSIFFFFFHFIIFFVFFQISRYYFSVIKLFILILYSFAVMPRQPFEFKAQTLGDDQHEMMVAESVPNSNIVGPMFLSTLAHAVLLSFVNYPEENQPLVVFGPPKSSKTAVLFEVLPRMVAARVGGLDPVFVRLTFSLANNPQSAAKRIWTELSEVARAFEIDCFDISEIVVPAEVTLVDAILKLPKLIEKIAPLFVAKDRQLWLLFDEISVRLCNSVSVDACCIGLLTAPRTYVSTIFAGSFFASRFCQRNGTIFPLAQGHGREGSRQCSTLLLRHEHGQLSEFCEQDPA